MPTPMPTIAVSRFIPAASSEPKVSTRTRTATATPMNSVAPIVTPVVPKALPPTATSQAGVLGGGRGLLQCVEAAGVELARAATSNCTVARAARPSGLIAWLSKGLTTASTCGARCGRGDRPARSPRAYGGSATVAPVGGDEDDLRAGARRRRARPRRAGRARPGTPSRDGERVVEGAADGEQQGHDRAEDGEPGHRDEAAVAEGGAAEPGEEGAMGAVLRGSVGGAGRRWRRAAGAAARCVRGRRSRGRPGRPRDLRITTPSCSGDDDPGELGGREGRGGARRRAATVSISAVSRRCSALGVLGAARRPPRVPGGVQARTRCARAPRCGRRGTWTGSARRPRRPGRPPARCRRAASSARARLRAVSRANSAPNSSSLVRKLE